MPLTIKGLTYFQGESLVLIKSIQLIWNYEPTNRIRRSVDLISSSAFVFHLLWLLTSIIVYLLLLRIIEKGTLRWIIFNRWVAVLWIYCICISQIMCNNVLICPLNKLRILIWFEQYLPHFPIDRIIIAECRYRPLLNCSALVHWTGISTGRDWRDDWAKAVKGGLVGMDGKKQKIRIVINPFALLFPSLLWFTKDKRNNGRGARKVDDLHVLIFDTRQGIKMPENNEFGNRVGCRPSFYCYNQNVFVVLLVDHNTSVRSMRNPRVLDAEVDSEQTQKIIQLIARLFSLRHSIFWFLIATVVPPPPFGYPVLLHKNQLTSCDRLGSSLTVLVPVCWFFSCASLCLFVFSAIHHNSWWMLGYYKRRRVAVAALPTVICTPLSSLNFVSPSYKMRKTREQWFWLSKMTLPLDQTKQPTSTKQELEGCKSLSQWKWVRLFSLFVWLWHLREKRRRRRVFDCNWMRVFEWTNTTTAPGRRRTTECESIKWRTKGSTTIKWGGWCKGPNK